jgi:hypothetical protein
MLANFREKRDNKFVTKTYKLGLLKSEDEVEAMLSRR